MIAGQFTINTASTQAEYLAFMAKGQEVGRLHYGPPMRFTGDVEESAKVFFEYVANIALARAAAQQRSPT